MIRVNILSTSPSADTLPEFVHDEKTFAFGSIGVEGPTKLIDGELWIFVDWIIPELSGLEMCRRLRADRRTADAHITMVLDRDDHGDRKRALTAGADDYVIGPIDRNIMLDRVMALQAGKPSRPVGQVFTAGQLQIDLAAELARWNGKPVLLAPNELRLFRYMAENPNRILSREELIGGLGKVGDQDSLRTVDVWIKRLRQGLKSAGAPPMVRTVQGKGYVLDLFE